MSNVIAFPAPRVQAVANTGYPKWAALRIGGVRHRICFVWTEGRHVYLEAMCGRTGMPTSGSDAICGHCRKRGWDPEWDFG